jgi:hypothetical protein
MTVSKIATRHWLKAVTWVESQWQVLILNSAARKFAVYVTTARIFLSPIRCEHRGAIAEQFSCCVYLRQRKLVASFSQPQDFSDYHTFGSR